MAPVGRDKKVIIMKIWGAVKWLDVKTDRISSKGTHGQTAIKKSNYC